MKIKNVTEVVTGEGSVPVKRKELSIIDQYILEEKGLSKEQVATLKRYQGTEYDATFIIKKRMKK